jgi:hypothetical protein
MKSTVALILLLVSVNIQAQQIKGKVCLEKDKSPAQFASVGLLQLPDSSIVTGVITLSDGGYHFEPVKPGNYFIRVNLIGYRVTGKNVTVNNQVTVADTIFLAENPTSLEEVVVVGERLKGKEMVDRTTYTIPPVVAKSVTNGYELLKKIPQVNVDFQNNVTLNGSTNFIIQVDGRQRSKEFLAKLMPSDIESVEIISNPSGKYEGNIDGVINIILKKEARFGFSGMFGAFVRPNSKPTGAGTASLDYGMGKITFYVTLYAFYQGLNNITDVVSRFPLKSDSTVNMNGNGNFSVSAVSVIQGLIIISLTRIT